MGLAKKQKLTNNTNRWSSTLRLILIPIFIVTSLTISLAQELSYVPGELLVKLKSSSLRKTITTRDTKLGLPSLDALNQARGIKRIESLIYKHTNNKYTNNK